MELGKSVGATHVINTSEMEGDLVSVVKELTGGVGASLVLDTTGSMELIQNGMDFTGNRGQMMIIGVPPPDGFLSTHLMTFMQVSSYHTFWEN